MYTLTLVLLSCVCILADLFISLTCSVSSVLLHTYALVYALCVSSLSCYLICIDASFSERKRGERSREINVTGQMEHKAYTDRCRVCACVC